MLVWLLRNLKFEMSEDNENTITVDVISSALLTWLLVPILRSSASNYNIEPVVSVVGSGIHFWTYFPERKTPNSLATLNDEKTADMENRFAHSHLIQSPLSHTFPSVLHDRLEGGSTTDSRIRSYTVSKYLQLFAVRAIAAGTATKSPFVTVNTVNPNLCYTDLGRSMEGKTNYS